MKNFTFLLEKAIPRTKHIGHVGIQKEKRHIQYIHENYALHKHLGTSTGYAKDDYLYHYRLGSYGSELKVVWFRIMQC